MKETELIKRIEALEREIAEMKKQQIKYPLDAESFKILNKYFLSVQGYLDFNSSSGSIIRNMLVSQDNKLEAVGVLGRLTRFTVNTSTNVLTLSEGNFADDAQVALLSTDTLPAPLDDSIPYYVINSSGRTLKLSASVGGAAVDITNTGTGAHYIFFYT
jgi:hypothetical protein